MLKFTFCLLVVTPALISSEKVRFDNFTLYKVLPKNAEHIKVLQELQNDISYDFWTDPVASAEFVNILAGPSNKNLLENMLNGYQMKYEISMENAQEVIESQAIKKYTRSSYRSITWDAYYTLEDIEAWMTDVAAAYPDIVTEVIGGETYEGRQIKGMKLTHGGDKRVIFIEAGIHSREWITMSFACYLINELLTSSEPEIMAAARNYEWYIFPVTNPDGYVWTHESNRMWRKNRRPVDGTNYGVDLNRNWNSNWLVTGASTNPTQENYAGAGPFSEPETRSLSEFIRGVGDKIDLYLSFHSYSQLLLLPFGNSTEQYANYDEAINVGRRAMGALSVRYGTQYVTGNIAEAIYEATGTSIDWVKEAFEVPLVYCYELRDRGTYGFLLPADQILPNHLEAMDSVMEIIHQAQRFGIMNGVDGRQSSLLLVMVFAIVKLVL